MFIERFQSSVKNKTLCKAVLLSLRIAIVSGVVIICIVSYRNTITPNGIIIHHSALPYAEIEPSKYLPLINEIHKKRGFGIFYWGHTYYIGYHYLILPDGRLEKGRPERCQGSHTRGYNSCL